jgi:hypothetical protein
MKRYLLITLLLLVQANITSPVFAETQLPGYHPERLPRPLVDIGIKIQISQSSEGFLTYNYEIYNPPINNGRIVSIDIDIQRGAGKAYVRGDGLPRAQRCYIPIDLMPVITQVGIDSPPNWICGVGTEKMAFWGADDYPYEILPGQSLSGMVLTSYGLPGIRNIIVMPLIKNSIYPNIDKYDVDMDVLRRVQLQDRDRLSFKSKTVGPISPPAVFDPISFLDYMIDLKHQAASLGWIDNSGIVNSLDVKLDNAKNKLTLGDNSTAKNILNAFINDVEAQADKHLTSEAYALLKYNAAYLISNLPK